jgi:hypothetical protein
MRYPGESVQCFGHEFCVINFSSHLKPFLAELPGIAHLEAGIYPERVRHNMAGEAQATCLEAGRHRVWAFQGAAEGRYRFEVASAPKEPL